MVLIDKLISKHFCPGRNVIISLKQLILSKSDIFPAIEFVLLNCDFNILNSLPCSSAILLTFEYDR